MANELKHVSVGTELTQSEYESTSSHILDSQAAGDIIYASSTSQLSRLGIGTAGKILQVNSGASAPEWTATVTGVTSVLNTSLVIGRDSDNDIDFATDNTILFRASGADQIKLVDGALAPVTNNDVDLGTSSLEFKDAFFDGTVTADAFAGPITGDVTGTATNATHVTVADNESTNENNLIPFIEDTSATGNVGLESDGDFHYNPSSGTVTATTFVGNLTGTASTATVATTVTITDNESTNEDNAIIFTAGGDVDGGNIGLESDGTLTYNPSTGKITATGFIGALTGNADTATVATTVTITDNESTNEDNAIVFTAGGDVDGGNIGLESDGTLTYNPSTGKITATGFIGALTGNADTATALATGRTIAMTGDVAWTSASFDGSGNVTGAGTIQSGAVETGMIAADAITGAKIADDALDSEHYTDGSIDTAHLAADAVTGAKIADDAIDSEHYTDGSIDTAHIADNNVTAAKIFDLARGSVLYGNASAETAELTAGSANTVLTSDGTDISWAAASGGGIENVDMWRLHTSLAGDAAPISSNLERVDTGGFAQLGTGMTESSGVFTFPQTGIYKVTFHATLSAVDSTDTNVTYSIKTTNNNGTSYTTNTSHILLSLYNSSAQTSGTTHIIFDVTNTSNDKVAFKVAGQAGSNKTEGWTAINYTYFLFERLGDT